MMLNKITDKKILKTWVDHHPEMDRQCNLMLEVGQELNTNTADFPKGQYTLIYPFNWRACNASKIMISSLSKKNKIQDFFDQLTNKIITDAYIVPQTNELQIEIDAYTITTISLYQSFDWCILDHTTNHTFSSDKIRLQSHIKNGTEDLDPFFKRKLFLHCMNIELTPAILQKQISQLKEH